MTIYVLHSQSDSLVGNRNSSSMVWGVYDDKGKAETARENLIDRFKKEWAKEGDTARVMDLGDKCYLTRLNPAETELQKTTITIKGKELNA